MTGEHINFAATLGIVGGLVTAIYGAVEVYYDVGVSAGIVGIVFGFLIMIVSLILAGSPSFHVGLGVLIILFSLISLVSVGGGNGIGFLLCVIGGACAIAFSHEDWRVPVTIGSIPSGPPAGLPPIDRAGPPSPPAGVATPSASQEPSYRGCPHCGKASDAGLASCPHCGTPFG